MNETVPKVGTGEQRGPLPHIAVVAATAISLSACASYDTGAYGTPTTSNEQISTSSSPTRSSSPTEITAHTEVLTTEKPTAPSVATTQIEQPTQTPTSVESPQTHPEPSHIPEETTTPATTIELPAPVEVTPIDHQATIDCMVARCIALTFDDGPGPYTELLLDHLDQYDAKATFFLVGERIEPYAPVAIDIAERGHQIGNHSWDHDDLTLKTPIDAANDVWYTNDVITSWTGVAPKVMRPPYGATNQAIVDAIGIPQILWSIDTEDWKYHDSNYVASYVIEHAGRGDIVLMHDIHQTSVDAVPTILESLTTSGYELVTLETLFGSTPPNGIYNRQNIVVK